MGYDRSNNLLYLVNDSDTATQQTPRASSYAEGSESNSNHLVLALGVKTLFKMAFQCQRIVYTCSPGRKRRQHRMAGHEFVPGVSQRLRDPLVSMLRGP